MFIKHYLFIICFSPEALWSGLVGENYLANDISIKMCKLKVVQTFTELLKL